MKEIVAITFTLLLLGCTTKQRTDTNNEALVPTSSQSKVVFDTLVLNANMKGNLLNEKYRLGSSELDFYTPFISEMDIAKKRILTDQYTITEITYLGLLNDLDTRNAYHVVSNFKRIGIGEMESPRGISTLCFIDKDLKRMITYTMNLPNHLPEYVDASVLYFNIDDEKIGISIWGGLPPMLCLPKLGCY